MDGRKEKLAFAAFPFWLLPCRISFLCLLSYAAFGHSVEVALGRLAYAGRELAERVLYLV